MNNMNETIGLRVLSVSPSHREANINVNGSVIIEFSADINPATLTKNIVVLEDYNKIYNNVSSLKDYSQYHVVKGTISYKDRILTYTPQERFNTDSCYIVILNDGISDITGNHMIKKYVTCFYTEAVATFPRCEIVSPKYGLICNSIPTFVWKNQGSESYVFQVSKSNTFELLTYDKVIAGNHIEETITHTPEFEASEGIYHIRIKSENGEWSNTHQIFIKPIVDAVIAEQDTPEITQLEEFLDNLEDPIEILEYFPAKDSVNIGLKINIVYIKIRGRVDESKLHLEDSYIYGESFDEEHEEYAHEIVDGKWTLVYDSYFDVTYVIFTPVILSDVEEKEYIETLRSGNLIERSGANASG